MSTKLLIICSIILALITLAIGFINGSDRFAVDFGIWGTSAPSWAVLVLIWVYLYTNKGKRCNKDKK